MPCIRCTLRPRRAEAARRSDDAAPGRRGEWRPAPAPLGVPARARAPGPRAAARRFRWGWGCDSQAEGDLQLRARAVRALARHERHLGRARERQAEVVDAVVDPVLDE